jgi:hypothetical protein
VIQRIVADREQGGNHPGSGDLKLSARTGCLAVLGIGALLFILLLGVILLTLQGEINLLTQERTGIRLWLVSAEGQQGIAVSSSHIFSEREETTVVCITTRVRFLLWRSVNTEPTQAYCEC